MMESTDFLGNPGRQCKNCIYFGAESESHGTCHRHAPKPVVYDYKDGGKMCVFHPTIWPSVEPYEFCGEFVDDRQFHSHNK